MAGVTPSPPWSSVSDGCHGREGRGARGPSLSLDPSIPHTARSGHARAGTFSDQLKESVWGDLCPWLRRGRPLQPPQERAAARGPDGRCAPGTRAPQGSRRPPPATPSWTLDLIPGPPTSSIRKETRFPGAPSWDEAFPACTCPDACPLGPGRPGCCRACGSGEALSRCRLQGLPLGSRHLS